MSCSKLYSFLKPKKEKKKKKRWHYITYILHNPKQKESEPPLCLLVLQVSELRTVLRFLVHSNRSSCLLFYLIGAVRVGALDFVKDVSGLLNPLCGALLHPLPHPHFLFDFAFSPFFRSFFPFFFFLFLSLHTLVSSLLLCLSLFCILLISGRNLYCIYVRGGKGEINTLK